MRVQRVWKLEEGGFLVSYEKAAKGGVDRAGRQSRLYQTGQR